MTTSDREWFDANAGLRCKRLRGRAKIIHSIREFFLEREFDDVETPLMVPSPGLEVHLSAFEVVGASRRRWLITSPEYQMKRLLSASFEKIFQICRCFRNEELGSLHEPEFTMLEWYRAHAGSEEVMRDTEELVLYLARKLYGRDEIPGLGDTWVNVSVPWPRLTVEDAFSKYATKTLHDVLRNEDAFFRELVDYVEPALGHQRPVFLTHYPASMASLARLHPDAPDTADRFEAYISSVELCNGFGELTDWQEQQRRFERELQTRQSRGLPIYPVDNRFIDALKQGIPPSGGNALGIDRLVMLLLGERNIENVLAFPASRL